MPSVSKPARAREVLDRRLESWRGAAKEAPRPHGGWIRAIRDALGMSAAELATRMDVAQSTVARLESSERHGRIQLSSLERAADALGCDLVYALVPRRPLDELVEGQAKQLALAHLRSLGHTMALEDQGLTDAQTTAKYDLLVHHYMTSPGLWRREPVSKR
jgi:predicted DNA-binding mobile mystery protein A